VHPQEAKLLKLLKKVKKGKASELARKLRLSSDIVARIAYSLSRRGYVNVKKVKERYLEYTTEGKEVLKKGLPERRLLRKLPANVNKLDTRERIALGWAVRKGWVEVKNGIARKIVEKPPITDEEIAIKDLSKATGEILKILRKRKWVEEKERVEYEIEITPQGEKAKIEEEITQLTPEMLVGGKWKNKKFLSYSPTDPVPQIYPARLHPLTEIIEKVRRIFLELGFREARGNYVETAFWNFDALFVPQDHPAREMQDTFYIQGKGEIPKELAKRVGKIHRKIWGRWSNREAARLLLRTHTTVVSARMLAEVKPPAKVFTVDRVFRNETIDYKHLAELHQVEGIVFAKDVSLKHLFGYLKHFFSKLGFEKVRFRPAYFPYTEPSVEVDAWFEPKKTWIEIGGAGIFREEVVEPLTGYDYPVLAWGLGLERIAMLHYGLKDIRELYRSDIDWLRRREVFL